MQFNIISLKVWQPLISNYHVLHKTKSNTIDFLKALLYLRTLEKNLWGHDLFKSLRRFIAWMSWSSHLRSHLEDGLWFRTKARISKFNIGFWIILSVFSFRLNLYVLIIVFVWVLFTLNQDSKDYVFQKWCSILNMALEPHYSLCRTL